LATGLGDLGPAHGRVGALPGDDAGLRRAGRAHPHLREPGRARRPRLERGRAGRRGGPRGARAPPRPDARPVGHGRRVGDQSRRVRRVMPEPGHLIHVGFPKAGSTSLQAWFERHPELVYAHGRFGGYRTLRHLPARTGDPSRGPAWHVSSEERLVLPAPDDLGDLNTLGDVRERRARACVVLRLLSPGATILLVTRGFRGALQSIYAHFVSAGGRLGIGEAFGSGRVDLDALLDYDEAIALYEQAFGAENVIVLPFELLRDDPSAFLSALSKRLG